MTHALAATTQNEWVCIIFCLAQMMLFVICGTLIVKADRNKNYGNRIARIVVEFVFFTAINCVWLTIYIIKHL